MRQPSRRPSPRCASPRWVGRRRSAASGREGDRPAAGSWTPSRRCPPTRWPPGRRPGGCARAGAGRRCHRSRRRSWGSSSSRVSSSSYVRTLSQWPVLLRELQVAGRRQTHRADRRAEVTLQGMPEAQRGLARRGRGDQSGRAEEVLLDQPVGQQPGRPVERHEQRGPLLAVTVAVGTDDPVAVVDQRQGAALLAHVGEPAVPDATGLEHGVGGHGQVAEDRARRARCPGRPRRRPPRTPMRGCGPRARAPGRTASSSAGRPARRR